MKETTDDSAAEASGRNAGRESGASSRAFARFRNTLAAVGLSLTAVVAIEQIEFTTTSPVARRLFETQDMPVLLLSAALLIVLAALGPSSDWMRWAGRSVRLDRLVLALPILAAGAVVALGTKIVAFDYALTRDEAMAEFDAKIIASGHLLAPVPSQWRPFADALQPEYLLPVPGHVAWASSYLPGNAAIRAVLGLVVPGALVNAILAVAALVALLGVARQLWPQQRMAWTVAVVLAASSSQLLFMAMTPYAMSAHLALNLIWFWLFLRGTPSAHVLAVGVGFLATGLHQLIFHPLFVAPFLLQLLIERRWRLSCFYIASYAAICVFWIAYWQLLLTSAGIAPEAAGAVGSSYLVSRISALLVNFSFSGIETMTQNLLRFAAWQNPLLLALFVPGFAAAWRSGGTQRSLAGGIVLTLVVMFILLPFQDYGWGYRYVHGLLGNAALLAALGWMSLTAAMTKADRTWASSILAASTAVAVLVLVPVHASQMRAQIAPYANAQAAIASDRADAVVVYSIEIYYGNDLVRNDPALTNKPLTFDIRFLDEAMVRDLCSRYRVRLFGGEDAARYGIGVNDPAGHPDYARLRLLRTMIEAPACRGSRHD